MSNNYPEPYQGTEKYVFISYSHINKEIVYEDIKKLKEMGVRIWYDKGIPPGPRWDEYVYPKIISDQCSLVLFYVTESFFFSEAIAREIKIVFNTEDCEKGVKDSFSVNVGGGPAIDMLLNSTRRLQKREENTRLMLNYFDEKRIYIKRLANSDDHIDQIFAEVAKYDVIDERYKYKARKNDRLYDVILIGKNSTFTNSIKQGIIDTYSKMPDVNFNSYLIDTIEDENPDEKMLEYIDNNKSIIDGLMLRPINHISKRLIEQLESLIAAGKKVILLDKNFNQSQMKVFKYPLPLFIASDFRYGGKMIAERINDFIALHSEEEYKIILLDGPKNIVSAQQRVSAIKEVFDVTNRDVNMTTFIINSFDVEENIALLEQKMHTLFLKEKDILPNCSLYLYLANDNIAKGVIQLYKAQEDSYIKKYISKAKSVIFAGYDGIKDIKGDIDLFRFDVNSLTIDVMPTIQGHKAAEAMMKIMTNSQNQEPILLRPQIRENINLKPLRGKSIINVTQYLDNKKLIIFDLDGTIANTEALHFRSYQKLLQRFSIDFTFRDFESYIGNSEITIWEMLIMDYNLNIDISKMMVERTQIVLELILQENLQPFDYFIQIIERYPNIEKVILSSQMPDVIFFLLKKWNIYNIFSHDRVVSVSDKKRKKEDVLRNPGAFYSLSDTVYEPKDILLFEDSNGILKVARKLGIDAIGIEHQFNCHKLENCNYILNEEISSGIFIGLAGIDIVHYQNSALPEENSKCKTNDFEVYVGGPAANAAITYASLGGDATLICCIGDSEIGKALKGMLKRRGVTVIDVVKDEISVPNISSVIINKTNGNRTIISGQNSYNDLSSKVDKTIFHGMDFVLYDCNAPELFDANLDNIKEIPLILDAGSYKPHIKNVLTYADEVISSNQFGMNEKNVLELQDDYSFHFAAISNGNKPIRYREKSNPFENQFEIDEISEVVDTLGAGDVLHGAYCFYRFQEKMDCVSSLKNAAKCATESVKHRGILKNYDYAQPVI
jgi:sugar/nucleoside kinase (ribokinase family)/beta-phosphoglucomutase-like phosphatase (HAD superfamily)/ABC-type sugar transport system substrate-binding protein